MAITYTPKVGEVLECNFGNFKVKDDGYDDFNFDGRVPNEMIKKRMVVVVNSKLGGNCLVVPISSTKNIGSINIGHHIFVDQQYFKVTDFYDLRDRWAKCETIQLVSKKRLFKMRDSSGRFDLYLPSEVVTCVQKGVIKAINANSLLSKTIDKPK